ncbi:MAG: type I glyceraldehyde-3-phosphate dehydrogenase [Candidatus Oxydemutatoraceae bacterium WSBS_2016_MAG_OTU14]
MKTKVAINGYGRIGRNILRALYECGEQFRDQIEIVALNNRSPIESCVHTTRYDSTHGRFQFPVESQGTDLIVDGDRIRYFSESNPQQIPWGDFEVDVVLECTGKFTTQERAQAHFDSGAKRVLLSAPGKDADITIVYGLNHTDIKPEHRLISNASCTTNCLAPVAHVLNKSIGIEHGLITTIHAYTNDQVLIDANHTDLRRARSATTSMIPTKTGAALAVGLVIPELQGKLDGYAVRVPTLNVSLVDFTFVPSRSTTVEEINDILKSAAAKEMHGILQCSEEPLVSTDYNHTTASSIYDVALTKVMNQKLVKVYLWYDNEWAYACRMLDVALWMKNNL